MPRPQVGRAINAPPSLLHLVQPLLNSCHVRPSLSTIVFLYYYRAGNVNIVKIGKQFPLRQKCDNTHKKDTLLTVFNPLFLFLFPCLYFT